MSTEDHQFSPDDINFLIPANSDIPPQDIIDQLQRTPPLNTSPNGKLKPVSPNESGDQPFNPEPPPTFFPWGRTTRFLATRSLRSLKGR